MMMSTKSAAFVTHVKMSTTKTKENPQKDHFQTSLHQRLNERKAGK